MVAIATAFARQLVAMAKNVILAILYTRIDEMPEFLLDILAYDFKIDWWDPNYAIEEKRQTLKDSWYVHRHLGTKAAVETAISAIFKDSRVEEWFEYGGLAASPLAYPRPAPLRKSRTMYCHGCSITRICVRILTASATRSREPVRFMLVAAAALVLVLRCIRHLT